MRFPRAYIVGCFAMVGLLRAESVQLDCAAVFNARPVTVLHEGRVVPWTTGMDGGGKADGFATVGAARAKGDPVEHALPDDGTFAADCTRPFVQLPYARAGANQAQARSMADADSWDLPVWEKKYRQLFLFFTSAEGASQLTLVLHYSDGANDTRTIEMPDYYRAPDASNKELFALASNLAKWNAAGKLAEADHHYIYGWQVVLDASRKLKSITLSKGPAGYAVFWGATATE